MGSRIVHVVKIHREYSIVEKKQHGLVGKPKSEEHKEKLRQAALRRDPETRKGRIVSEETKEKIRQAAIKRYESRPELKKQIREKLKASHSTPEMREKISRGVKEGFKNSVYYQENKKLISSKVRRGFTVSPETREKMSKARTGMKLSEESKVNIRIAMKKSHARPEVRERISRGIKKANSLKPRRVLTEAHKNKIREKTILYLQKGNFFKSSLEVKVEDYLNSKGVPYREQFRLDNRLFDFLVGESTVLECHGEFFHADPRFTKGRSLYQTQIDTRKVDKIKAKLATEKGYKYRVLWEREIVQGNFTFLDKIIEQEIFS